MNRKGEKHVGAGQEKSLPFTKITREVNQQHWRANNHYINIFGKSMEKVTYIWKIKLSRP